MVTAPQGERPGVGEPHERLFVAIPISDRVGALVRDHLSKLPLPGRPVPSENWHITLRFLGPTPHAAVRALTACFREVLLGSAFTITLGGLGAFPRPARASVLWLGVESGAARLGDLAADVERVVRSVGFPGAEHPFRAHLTLSRLAPPADVRTFTRHALRIGEPMRVTEVVLFQSRLGRGPAVYEPIDRFSLVG
jgi:2'-5' RNA ligase